MPSHHPGPIDEQPTPSPHQSFGRRAIERIESVARSVRPRAYEAMDDGTAHPVPLLRLAPSHAARSAVLGISAFAAWALVSWLLPRFVSTDGWSWQLTAIGLFAYGALTVGSMALLGWTSLAVICTRRLRRLVRMHLLPFWLLVLLATGAGTATAALASSGALVSAWLGSGVGFSVLLAGFTLARGLSGRRPRAVARAARHSLRRRRRVSGAPPAR